MKLIEDDWDAPQGVANKEIDYPDEMIAEFINWVRRTKAWRESPDILERRVLKLNRDLLNWRQRPTPQITQTVDHAVNVAIPLAVIDRAAEIKAKRLAGLEKARAAKKAKQVA